MDPPLLPDIVETHEEEDRVSNHSMSTNLSIPIFTRSDSPATNQEVETEDGDTPPETSSENHTPLPDIHADEGVDYDTDIDINEETEDIKDTSDQRVGKEDYKTSCSRLNIYPENKIVENLASSTLNLAHQGIGEDGMKALAKSLMRNEEVVNLKLEDNSITPVGVTFLVDMLCDNNFISYLDLSSNDVGTYGCLALKEMLLDNTTLLTLILKNCKIKDSDGVVLAEGIQSNESVVYLDLSHNEICEDGGMCIGDAIGINNTIEQLSLSWNHIRRKGAVQICTGLKRNYRLQKVDLSWNGLGYEGSLSLGQALKVNKHIEEMDVSSNRINWKCATTIASGLKHNYTLEVFKIGLNPLTMTGVQELLAAVTNEHSEMQYISFEGVPINRKLAYMAEMLSNSREFTMSHGGVIDTDDVMGKKKLIQIDPFTRLLNFLNDRSIRAVDLFRGLEKDKDQLVSREQFIAGLKNAQAPLETWEMVKVMEKLDKSEKGKINYRRLNDGIQEQRMANKHKEKKAKADARRIIREERKIMNPEVSITTTASRSGSAQPPHSRRESIASVPNSRRASRVSLNITQGLQDKRRSSAISVLSSRSTAASPKPTMGGSSTSRNILASAVDSHKKGVREGEMMRKLDRLSVTTNSTALPPSGGMFGKSQPNGRKTSLVSQGSA